MRYFNSLSQHKIPKQKTRVIRETLNPIWNETFVFAGHSARLNVDLFDYDIIGTNTKMGRVKLNVLDLPFDKEVVMSLPILVAKDRKGKKEKKVGKGAKDDEKEREKKKTAKPGETGYRGMVTLKLLREKMEVQHSPAANALSLRPGETYMESVAGVLVTYSTSIDISESDGKQSKSSSADVDLDRDYLMGEVLVTNRGLYLAVVDGTDCVDFPIFVAYGSVARISTSSGSDRTLTVYCKDLRTLQLKFPDSKASSRVSHYLENGAFPPDLKSSFAYKQGTALRQLKLSGHDGGGSIEDGFTGWGLYNPLAEFFERQQCSPALWRATTMNEGHKASPTYPSVFLVPQKIDDQVGLESN